MILTAAYNLRSKRGLRTLTKFFVVVFGDVDVLSKIFKFLYCDVTSAIESVRNFQRVDAFI